METEFRIAAYTNIQSFAETHDLPVVWPQTFADTGDGNSDDGEFIPQEVENVDAFLRPKITSVVPQQRGIKNGWSQYVYIVQIGICVKQGLGDLVATDIFDLIRSEWPIKSEFETENHKYIQLINFGLRAPVRTGAWINNPAITRYQTIS